jgi:hypothetical protein
MKGYLRLKRYYRFCNHYFTIKKKAICMSYKWLFLFKTKLNRTFFQKFPESISIC